MQGTPPPPERLVTLENWEYAPHNRWGFQHVRDLVPTARIRRGEGPVWRLPRSDQDLSTVPVKISASREKPLDDFLESTYTDGFLVLHEGRIVYERYLNSMTPDTTHLLMSVSKSVTSTITGILVADGKLDPSWLVTDVIPELRGTSFEGCTVRHLLDMRAGTRFNEDYDDPRADVRVYEQIYLWAPRTGRRLPTDACEYFKMLRNSGPHGGPFEYRSVLTDVLGWVNERAGGARLAQLISERLWAPMGAEFDAEITVDGHGNAMADGGVCCTLRDLARFGQLMLNGGRRGARKIVPRAWIRDILHPDDDTVEAFAPTADAREFPKGAYYRNKWWVVDPSVPVYQGSGINGQTVFIHGPSRVVIAKFSTWPDAWRPKWAVPTRLACADLAEKLAAGRV